MKKPEPICLCKACGKSSNAGNSCLFEEKERMAACPSFIRMKAKKAAKK